MVKAELVLPVAPGDPQIDKVGVLRSHERLAGVEGQTDRFAVELCLGCGAEGARTRIERKAVGVTLGSIETGATADGEELRLGRQGAALEGFARPSGISFPWRKIRSGKMKES